MSDNPNVQRQGIRDAAAEARTFPKSDPPPAGAATGGSHADAVQASRAAAPDRHAKALRDSPVAESGAANPIKNGPVEGPLIKTDPANSPTAQVIAANAMKVYGEGLPGHPGATEGATTVSKGR